MNIPKKEGSVKIIKQATCELTTLIVVWTWQMLMLCQNVAFIWSTRLGSLMKWGKNSMFLCLCTNWEAWCSFVLKNLFLSSLLLLCVLHELPASSYSVILDSAWLLCPCQCYHGFVTFILLACRIQRHFCFIYANSSCKASNFNSLSAEAVPNQVLQRESLGTFPSGAVWGT